MRMCMGKSQTNAIRRNKNMMKAVAYGLEVIYEE